VLNKIVLIIWYRQKYLSLKFFSQNLETSLQVYFCQNCVCNFRIFCWKAIRSRDVSQRRKRFSIDHHWGAPVCILVGVQVWAATALVVAACRLAGFPKRYQQRVRKFVVIALFYLLTELADILSCQVEARRLALTYFEVRFTDFLVNQFLSSKGF